MTLYFDNVFAGEAVWRPHEKHETVVDGLAIRFDFPERKCVGCSAGRPRPLRTKNPVCQLIGAVAGYADNRDTAFAGWCRLCRNRVFVLRHALEVPWMRVCIIAKNPDGGDPRILQTAFRMCKVRREDRQKP